MESGGGFKSLIRWVSGRWRIWAAAALVGGVVAAAAAMTLPKRYRAEVLVVIHPPEDLGEFGPTMLSPAYLETLSVFADLASGAELLSRAARECGGPLTASDVDASVAVRTLRVGVTLEQPDRALRTARWIAQEVVAKSAEMGVAERLSVADEGAPPDRPDGRSAWSYAFGAAFFSGALALAFLALRDDPLSDA